MTQSNPYVLQNVTTRGFLLLDTTQRPMPEAFIASIHARIFSVGTSVVYGTMVLSKSIIRNVMPRERSASAVTSVSAGKIRSGTKQKAIFNLPN